MNKITLFLSFLALLVLAATASYVVGRIEGKSIANDQYAQQAREWEARVFEVQQSSDSKISNIVSEYTKNIQKYQREIDKLSRQQPIIIERVVEVYIPRDVDTAVPRGFVELHNTAAAGQPLSDSTVLNASSDSDKSLSDVGTVVARNYYQCNAIREQLHALQDVVEQYRLKQMELVR
jgi:hypothetical protein